jgi:hypothetical protein
MLIKILYKTLINNIIAAFARAKILFYMENKIKISKKIKLKSPIEKTIGLFFNFFIFDSTVRKKFY